MAKKFASFSKKMAFQALAQAITTPNRSRGSNSRTILTKTPKTLHINTLHPKTLFSEPSDTILADFSDRNIQINF